MTRAEAFVELVVLLCIGIPLYRTSLRFMEGTVLVLIAMLALAALVLRRWAG
jgi:hypothetical protein